MLLEHVLVCLLVQSQVHVVGPFDVEQLLSLKFLQTFFHCHLLTLECHVDYWFFSINMNFCMSSFFVSIGTFLCIWCKMPFGTMTPLNAFA